VTYFKFNENAEPQPSVPATPGARKGEGRLSKEDVQRIVSSLVTSAEQLVDGELSQDRARATDYFHGELFGNEEVGRSQVVHTEVRDTVLGTLPSLLRIFFGPQRVVEFNARTPTGVAGAKQATEYVQYVFAEDNGGFLLTDDVLKDGLIRRLGIFKWGWDDGRTVAHEEDDATPERLQALAARDDVELTRVETDKDGKFTGTVEYTVKHDGRVRVWSVPDEEFIFNRNATGVDGALFIGHRTQQTRGDLIALGYDAAEIDEFGGDGEGDEKLNNNVEAIARMANQSPNRSQRDPDAGDANKLIAHVEGYVLLDVDGDGTAELRQVCTIGSGHHVVRNTPADEVPFSVFTPYREPHALIGMSQADLTMDIQLIKSSLIRGMLDSFVLSIFPRTTVLEGMASIEDVLNNEIGAPIRIKRDGAVVPFNHPFTGESAMPILSYFDDVSESRTGRHRGIGGPDADALQSSTSQAVGAAIGASQEQIEMIARIFAEQALKPLFRGIYRLLVKHQPKERLAKLRGEYVPVDVAQWDADMDASVTVALGTSFVEQRMAALEGLATKQEGVLQLLGTGPENPLTSVAMLRETYARWTELAGFRDVTSFWKPVDPNYAPPPQQPQMTPEQTIANAQLQIEQMRTQKDLEIKQAELQLKQQQQQFTQDLELRKLAQDYTLRLYQIDAQFKADYQESDLERDSAADEAALKGAMDVRRQQHAEETARRQHALAAQAQEHEQGLAEDQQAHEQQMAQQQAEQQAAPGAGQ
jgi:hypothetical protein